MLAMMVIILQYVNVPNRHVIRLTTFYGNCCVAILFLVVKSCLTLFDPMICSPPTSSVHGISQARILEWHIPDPGIEPLSPGLAGGFFTTDPPGKPCLTIRLQ